MIEFTKIYSKLLGTGFYSSHRRQPLNIGLCWYSPTLLQLSRIFRVRRYWEDYSKTFISFRKFYDRIFNGSLLCDLEITLPLTIAGPRLSSFEEGGVPLILSRPMFPAHCAWLKFVFGMWKWHLKMWQICTFSKT